jgi:hypothetical protein
MNKEKSNLIPTGDPTIIVRKLAMDIILNHFALEIGLDGFDKLQKSQDGQEEGFDKKLRNL